MPGVVVWAATVPAAAAWASAGSAPVEVLAGEWARADSGWAATQDLAAVDGGRTEDLAMAVASSRGQRYL